jgi:hypothetical protein
MDAPLEQSCRDAAPSPEAARHSAVPGIIMPRPPDAKQTED